MFDGDEREKPEKTKEKRAGGGRSNVDQELCRADVLKGEPKTDEDDAKPKINETPKTTRMSKDGSRTRQLPVDSQRSLQGPSENGDGPSTTTVSNVPHLSGIEEGQVSLSANQSPPVTSQHAPEAVGPDAPLIVPWVPTRQRARSSPSRKLGGRRLRTNQKRENTGRQFIIILLLRKSIAWKSQDRIHRVLDKRRAYKRTYTTFMYVVYVTQYDVELLQRLECLLEKRLAEWPTDKEDVLAMHPTVNESGRVAANELRAAGKQQKSRKRKRQAGEK
ncbi:hypothetical protein F5146DRAFT_1124138 [Armillaria mellea]|nr:hypothetical protein F5146DRAFT_1124138 [Armillaria mellea]